MTKADSSRPLPRPLGERIVATLAAPRRLARSLRERPMWPDALLLTTALAAVVAAAQPAAVYLEQVENPVTRLGEPVEITSAPEQVVTWGRLIAAFSALPGHPMIALAVAGLLYLAFSLLGRGPATFRHYLALASHALFIFVLGGLAALPLQWATGDPGAGFSLAALSPALADAGSRLVRGLAAADLFTLWTLAVLGVGSATLNGRRSPAPELLALGGAYLALLVLTAAPGA